VRKPSEENTGQRRFDIIPMFITHESPRKAIAFARNPNPKQNRSCRLIHPYPWSQAYQSHLYPPNRYHPNQSHGSGSGSSISTHASNGDGDDDVHDDASSPPHSHHTPDTIPPSHYPHTPAAAAAHTLSPPYASYACVPAHSLQ
jgi:hypothetical protein